MAECITDEEKEAFAKAIESSRELIGSGKHNGCPCSQIQCEWHGKCFECVLIHRVKKHHLPECLQPIIRDILAPLAKTAEMKVLDDRPAREYWAYLREHDRNKSK